MLHEHCHLSRHGCLVFTHGFLLNECPFEPYQLEIFYTASVQCSITYVYKYFALKHTIIYYMQVTRKTRTLYLSLYVPSRRVLDIPSWYFPDNFVSRAERSRYSCLFAVAECLCRGLFSWFDPGRLHLVRYRHIAVLRHPNPHAAVAFYHTRSSRTAKLVRE